jgi:hypothetical protein
MIDWGLMVRTVDLAVPKIWANVLVRRALYQVTGGCCTYTLLCANQNSTCRDKGHSTY